MDGLIRLGGSLVLLAVFAIFAFILWQVIPLFGGAHVEAFPPVEAAAPADILLAGTAADEPWLLDRAGTLHFPLSKTTLRPPGWQRADRVQAAAFEPVSGTLFARLQGGSLWRLGVKGPAEVTAARLPPLFDQPVEDVRLSVRSGPGGVRLLAALAVTPQGPRLHLRRLPATPDRFFTLGPVREPAPVDTDLTPLLRGDPVDTLPLPEDDAVLVLYAGGTADVLSLRARTATDTFAPFAQAPAASIALVGGGSLVFASPEGALAHYRRLPGKGHSEGPRFARTQGWEAPGGGADMAPRLSAGQRGRTFLASTGGHVRLVQATTGDVRWSGRLPGGVAEAVLGPRYDAFFLLGTDGRLHAFALDDPHPEAGLRAFFAPLAYENRAEPSWTWQSTGASVAFEPKLSLVPLFFGTLKGTFYALLFALPIALPGALYSAQFMRREHRRWVKPAVELLSSLPTVVLGFIGALWLAPRLSDDMPSLLLCLLAVPLAAVATVWLWRALPVRGRRSLPAGSEFFLVAPLLAVFLWTAWQLGPVVENALFVVTNPATGERVADFRLWWPQITGTSFEQRNTVIVGFLIGVTAIPVLFTLADDALVAVPGSLVSGSLALGASRWQTAVRLVLPAAAAGLLSAVMIGAARAMGETLIVVMATGNTPLMEWNPFSGMRTLSANLAIELPEASRGGTLYRTLFLGAFVLFLFTFLVNTLAELLRLRLRRSASLQSS